MLKQIKALASSFVLLITGATVIACTNNLTNLATRLMSTTEYRSLTKFPPRTWSVLNSASGDDIEILANTHGSLISADKYNRYYGELAEQSDSNIKKRQVGVPNKDFTQWTYTISNKAKWFDYQGKVIRKIKPSDFLNAIKYIAYKKNASPLAKNVSDIKNFSSIQKQINQNEVIDYRNHPAFEGLGVKPYDNNDTLEYTLEKPIPYFESKLLHNAFSPLPEEAFKQGSTYGQNYKTVWYSGAYSIKNYDSSRLIHLDKNPNYRFANLTNIKDLIWYINKNATDISRSKALFESGDITEFQVMPSDYYSWNKYVGENPAEPKFAGAYSIKKPNLNTFFLLFNYANSNVLSTDPKLSNAAIIASKALQSKDVRLLISTSLERSLFIKYYSNNLDYPTTSNVSSLLRNVFTPWNFVRSDQENKDFPEYIAKEYADHYSIEESKALELLKDGNDAFLNNKNLVPDKKELFNNIEQFKKDNKITEKIKLRLLMSEANQLTYNKWLLTMVDTFNSENNLIEIVPHLAIDSSNYIQIMNDNSYDLLIGGWIPDYSDTSAFQSSYQLNGFYSGYNGTSRLFKDLKFNQDDTAPDYDKIKKDNVYFTRLCTTETQNFYNNFKDFHDLVVKSNKITSTNANPSVGRSRSFARAEFLALYKYNLFLPLYERDGSWKVTISNMLQRSFSSIGYGMSDKRFSGRVLIDHLPTKSERYLFEARYREELEIAKADPSAFREGYQMVNNNEKKN